jgi:hypothetical protein
MLGQLEGELRAHGALLDGLLKGPRREDPGLPKDHSQRIRGSVAGPRRFPETRGPRLRARLRDWRGGLSPENPRAIARIQSRGSERPSSEVITAASGSWIPGYGIESGERRGPLSTEAR